MRLAMRAMQTESEMRDGALEWIAFGFDGGLALFGVLERHGFNTTEDGGGINEGDAFDAVLATAGRWCPRGRRKSSSKHSSNTSIR